LIPRELRPAEMKILVVEDDKRMAEVLQARARQAIWAGLGSGLHVLFRLNE